MPDFLLEVGTEELPAGYIEPALAQLKDALAQGLEAARLVFGEIRTAATPRRLAAWVPGVPARQTDVEVEVSGPPANVAFDASGNPTKAAIGFAKKQGVEPSALIRVQTPKGEYCAARRVEKGRDAGDILAELVPKALAGISFPKAMTWPESPQPFARPVRSVVALLGGDVVPLEAFGVKAGRVSEGHPFLAPGEVAVESADWRAYRERLRRASVLLDADERRASIRSEIQAALAPFGGGIEEEWLLDEVCYLVQWPKVVVGDFDPKFLQVPAPAVVAAMTEHQRYFPVRDAEGALKPHFLVVTDRGEGGADTIRLGNERVLRARLADAEFFFQQDRQKRLEDFREYLGGMVYLKGFGSYLDKCARLEKMVGCVCDALGHSQKVRAVAQRAAALCKADLVTAMVGEFPKLQGATGEIYADLDGEPEGVGKAIAEHYLPKSGDDPLPETEAGTALSLAEKLDNLAACFAAGLAPTGSADPYALRRQAQAVLRMAERAGRSLEMGGLVRDAVSLLPEGAAKGEETVQSILNFLHDRLMQFALDRGAPHDLARGALSRGFANVADFWLRLNALRELSARPEWASLVEVAERTWNISKVLDKKGEPDPALFQEPEERELWELVRARGGEVAAKVVAGEYAEAGLLYAKIFAEPVHRFFDRVFVNVDDAEVKRNRLRLIRAVHNLYGGRVADLSNITTGVG